MLEVIPLALVAATVSGSETGVLRAAMRTEGVNGATYVAFGRPSLGQHDGTTRLNISDHKVGVSADMARAASSYSDAVRISVALSTGLLVMAAVFSVISFIPGLSALSVATLVAAGAGVIFGTYGARRADLERRRNRN
jgi:hypothetical protein